MTNRPVAFITGASQGIGAATANEFAQRGYDVALLARNEANLNEVAEQVRSYGGNAIVLPVDLVDIDKAEQAVAKTAEQFGRIDVLVNNAAWRELVTMNKITLESWDKTIRIMLTAPAFLSRFVAPHMAEQGKGVIVMISSIMSQVTSGSGPPYIAAKGGLDNLTRDLAVLWGRKGIRVVAVNPGAIDTEMSGDYTSPDGENLTRQLRARSEDVIPLARWGKPEEIAKCIAWVASDDASYVTGTRINADGGWLANQNPYDSKRMQFPDEY